MYFFVDNNENMKYTDYRQGGMMKKLIKIQLRVGLFYNNGRG